MADSTIYVGPWINWSKGAYMGATLTTTCTQGLILVSFLAIFIIVCGSHIWGIVRYVLYQVRSTRTPQNALYHQEQVILRNSSSPSAALWDLLRVGWAWRGRAEYSFGRVIPLIGIAILQVSLIVIAGIFSSGIFSTTNEVLIRSPACGYMAYPAGPGDLQNTTHFAMLRAAFVEDKSAAETSSAYARSCYGDNAGAGCDFFTVPRISSTYEQTSCPFDPEMCMDPTTGALRADSGLIHTDIHLGINSQPKDALAYRRVTTCAPIRTNGYQRWYSGRDGSDQYLEFFYGNYIDMARGENLPVTFAYDKYSANYTDRVYPLNYQFASLGDAKASTFLPIKRLRRDDADVTLVFLTNNARYIGMVNDMWFNATEATTDMYGFGQYEYKAANPVAVMGCIEQHQLCDTSSSAGSRCSELTGWSALQKVHKYTGPQLAVADDLFNAISNSLIGDMVFNLGSASLLATLSVDGAGTLMSAPLPDNQWLTEVEGWQSYNMAHLQRLIVNVAAGPSKSSFNDYVIAPSTSDNDAFDVCSNQKVRNAHYYSFSMPGLAFVITIGCVVILVNICLSRFIGFWQSLLGRGTSKKEDWELDHMLQVQRLAYEGAKLGTWSSRKGRVPTTLQALTPDKFGKPGRAVNAYEPVELLERRVTPATTVVGFGEDANYKGFTAGPSVEVTAAPAYAEAADSRTYDMGFKDADMGAGRSSMHDGYDFEDHRTDTGARTSVEESYFPGDRGGNVGLRAREFV